jgi:ABC-type amino acid transport system permease subunit
MMLGFALSTSAVLYAHYLFALGFPLFAAVLVFLGKRSLLRGKNLLAAAVVSGFFALPSAWQLSLLVSKTSLYSFSRDPTFSLWTRNISLDWSTISLVLVISLLWLTKRDLRAHDSRIYESTLLLAICLWVYPSIALAAASIGSNTPVFVQRYGLYSVVGESLIQGVLLCLIGSETARRLVFLIASGLAVLCSPADQFFEEDWRSALRDIPQAPTESSVALLWTGLIETKDPTWALASQHRDYLLAPTRIYPLRIETGLIPLALTKFPPESVFSEKDRSVIGSARRIFLIIRNNSPFVLRFDEDTTVIRIPWITPNQALRIRSSKSYLGISVIELERMEPHQ